jgi:hypothetical protein
LSNILLNHIPQFRGRESYLNSSPPSTVVTFKEKKKKKRREVNPSHSHKIDIPQPKAEPNPQLSNPPFIQEQLRP